MERKLFNRISFVVDQLKEKGQKLTLNNVVVQSLFSQGGTLAENDKEVLQVIKMYTKGINEFEYTYKHNGKVETFTLNINAHGVMCLGFRTTDGKRFYQCAMDRHLEEQAQLLTVLEKIETGALMLQTFIPNNVEYVKKAVAKLP